MYVSLRLFQVSTKTGVKLHYFNLHVLVPAAFILGSDEYHTQAGNAISLVCIIENVSERDSEAVFTYGDACGSSRASDHSSSSSSKILQMEAAVEVP